MGRGLQLGLAVVVATSICGSAYAVSSPGPAHCRVIDSDKLPATSGGPLALCAAIERAVAAQSPGNAFKAEVRVLSSARLSASMTREGKRLPDQQFASMDRELRDDSFERFAAAIADQIAAERR